MTTLMVRGYDHESRRMNVPVSGMLAHTTRVMRHDTVDRRGSHTRPTRHTRVTVESERRLARAQAACCPPLPVMLPAPLPTAQRGRVMRLVPSVCVLVHHKNTQGMRPLLMARLLPSIHGIHERLITSPRLPGERARGGTRGRASHLRLPLCRALSRCSLSHSRPHLDASLSHLPTPTRLPPQLARHMHKVDQRQIGSMRLETAPSATNRCSSSSLLPPCLECGNHRRAGSQTG